jgi:hypothetical protein
MNEDMIDTEHLIRAFEDATLPMSDFHHREHLIIALWYAHHYPPPEALNRMRDGLQRLLVVSGRPATAYREDVTALWMRRAHDFLRCCQLSLTPDTTAAWLVHASKWAAKPPAAGATHTEQTNTS